MTVGKGSFDIELIFERLIAGTATLAQNFEPSDDLWIQLGQVGDGAFFHFAVIPAKGLAQKNCGRRVSVGNGFDIDGFQ